MHSGEALEKNVKVKRIQGGEWMLVNGGGGERQGSEERRAGLNRGNR